MAKFDKFFAAAKAAGIKEIEISISESHQLEVSMFHSAIDNYCDNNGMSVVARGIFANGKCGSATCDTWNAQKAKYLIDEIVRNAKVIENEDPVFIFKGSEKYKKINVYNKELDNIPVETKLAKLKELEGAIKAQDKRIVEVSEVAYSEASEKNTIANSNGLFLVQRNNYFVFMGQSIAKNENQTKSGFDIYLGDDFAKFNVNEFAKKVALDAIDRLDGIACPARKCKAVLSADTIISLIGAYIGHAEAEEVQKKSSLFMGKLGQKIASSKLTIEDKPLTKNIFGRWFDDEGVATYNKPIIKKGVLQTYLYNLTTAAKDGVQTTGNAQGRGGKKYAGPFYTVVKPGKKSLEELFAKAGDGVYVTGVTGLHAGMNPQSGDFSLQATGFEIVNGKKGRPFDLLTISGNLLKVFNDILEIGNDSKTSTGGTCTPSMLIRKIGVSGK